MDYVWAFVIGGLFCVAGQILMDTTKLTAPRILVIFVLAGVVLQAFNLYEPIVELAGNGATTPRLCVPRMWVSRWATARRLPRRPAT